MVPRAYARLVVLAVIGLVAGTVSGCQPGNAHTRQGLRDGAGTSLEAAIAQVEAGRKTTPLVREPTAAGDVTVTFLAKSPNGQVPRLVSDVTGWGENAADNTFDFNIGRMTRVGRSDWYSLDARVARAARVEYLVVHGTDYRLDPYNPRQAKRHGGGRASEFVTPGYQPPEEFADSPDVPAGKIAEAVIESRAFGGWRRVIVYTPPGYRQDGAYPLAVFQYGVSLASNAVVPPVPDGRLLRPPIEPDVPPRMLDHLIARRAIEPIVAVFVESRRLGDTRTYTDAAMRAFLTRDVLAWVASRYGVSRNADKRAILAISYGAKDGLDAAVTAPGAFGRLGLLIPGRRVALEPDLITKAAQADHRLRVTILAGLYDHANLPTASRLRQTFADGGHRLDYIEVAEGHSPMTWRSHMQEVVVSLFKRE